MNSADLDWTIGALSIGAGVNIGKDALSTRLDGNVIYSALEERGNMKTIRAGYWFSPTLGVSARLASETVLMNGAETNATSEIVMVNLGF